MLLFLIGERSLNRLVKGILIEATSKSIVSVILSRLYRYNWFHKWCLNWILWVLKLLVNEFICLECLLLELFLYSLLLSFDLKSLWADKIIAGSLNLFSFNLTACLSSESTGQVNYIRWNYMHSSVLLLLWWSIKLEGCLEVIAVSDKTAIVTIG